MNSPKELGYYFACLFCEQPGNEVECNQHLPQWFISKAVYEEARNDVHLVMERIKPTLTLEESLQLIREREKESSFVWHEGVAKALRDLAVNSKIPLSVISSAASGQNIRYQLHKVPKHIVEEYKKLRRVYEVTRKLKKS